MAIPNASREDLLEAMRLFDSRYRETDEWVDWEKNRAHRFAIEHEGQRYPVKMIVALATGASRRSFSGGMEPGQAGWLADRQGLNVVPLRRRNPAWSRDELVVALDFYLRHRPNPPGQSSDAIAELSAQLNRIAAAHGITGDATLRNPNGAYMKLMNFRSLDPAITEQGQIGLSRVSAADRKVWEDLGADPDRCRAEAERVLGELAADNSEPAYWAFAANPARYRIADALRDLEFDTWTTHERPIRANDRALIWQTRDGEGRRGVVALAEILEPPTVIADHSPYWVEPSEGEASKEQVRLRYIPLPKPLWIGGEHTSLLEQLSVARARGGSVFRVTAEQWRAVISIAGVPDLGRDDIIALSAGQQIARPLSVGQGFALTAGQRRIVERYAMERAKEHYALDWEVKDVSDTACFDLLCRDGEKELHVEVKGTTGIGETILLTKNEVEHAKAFPSIALFVVSEIILEHQSEKDWVASGGRISIYEPWHIASCDLAPITFQCRL